MLHALRHGLHEGHSAAKQAADTRSRLLLRHDFLFSRILKFLRWPGYNRLRHITLRGWPICYRFNRGDLQSLREVILDEVYACELPFHPTTVLDLGANIGLFSIWLSRRIQRSCTLPPPDKPAYFLAVEALPDNAAVAARNFEANAVRGEVIPAAVDQRDGEAWFKECAESNLGSLSPDGKPGEHRRIPVVGIRSLLDRLPGGQADVVKMDIEGAEGGLLSHDTDWLNHVRALMVEWHDDVAPSAPLIENVVRAGFRHERINTSRQENLSLFVKMP